MVQVGIQSQNLSGMLLMLTASMELMLKGGCTLSEAIGLLEQLEEGTSAGEELAQWQAEHSSGQARFSDFAKPGRVFPPLFIWLVANTGENLAEGFKRAAEIYHGRAMHRTEMLLYVALPLSILGLGIMITFQMYSIVLVFVRIITVLGTTG